MGPEDKLKGQLFSYMNSQKHTRNPDDAAFKNVSGLNGTSWINNGIVTIVYTIKDGSIYVSDPEDDSSSMKMGYLVGSSEEKIVVRGTVGPHQGRLMTGIIDA